MVPILRRRSSNVRVSGNNEVVLSGDKPFIIVCLLRLALLGLLATLGLPDLLEQGILTGQQLLNVYRANLA